MLFITDVSTVGSNLWSFQLNTKIVSCFSNLLKFLNHLREYVIITDVSIAGGNFDNLKNNLKFKPNDLKEGTLHQILDSGKLL